MFFDEAGGRPPAAHIGVGCVTIALFSQFTPDMETAHTTSDPDGNFTFTDVPVGPYTFKITAPAGYELGTKFPTTGTFVRTTDSPPVFISMKRTADPVGPCPPPPSEAAANAPADLAATGSPALRIAAAGLAAAVIGVALLVLVRRRRAPQ